MRGNLKTFTPFVCAVLILRGLADFVVTMQGHSKGQINVIHAVLFRLLYNAVYNTLWRIPVHIKHNSRTTSLKEIPSRFTAQRSKF